MAISGRIRSGLPLFQRILRSESSLPRICAADRSFGNPNFVRSEGSRSFAAQAKASPAKVKVPLTLFGGSGNYASALFIAATKANVLDKVEAEILDVVAASKKSPLFSQFIKDLSVPKETRVKAIFELFSEAGFSDVTKNFLAVLADNGRLKNVERIAQRFVELTMAHKGEVKVRVTTVIPLPEAEEKELKQTLKAILEGAKNVTIEQKIDPSILGGLVVEFGQKVFDMSIKTRAMQMEKFLREPLSG
ncbi:ATP synthase subunit O, mitochondrial [Iris pallida]|uniref:ATP synthase subunit O, mitochondrial n=1 Tax=Iris pallida TaxID=29817 RepID=A0AAX6E7I6_IRIPA|nr:ATP synthase subunit O, mitochondrial [Iris pallida]